ncbi:XrtX-associated membrane protein [Hymenobacter saemangeumensis]
MNTGRWVLVGLLVLVLFLAGVYDAQIFGFLTTAWQKVLSAVGLSRQAELLQQGVHGGVTHRALPAVLTYAAFYIALCLLLLRLLVHDPLQWRLVLQLYAGIIAAYVLIVAIGKLAGDAVWAYRLSRHLIDFLVGPLPIAGLLVLFRAGLGPQSTDSRMQAK